MSKHPTFGSDCPVHSALYVTDPLSQLVSLLRPRAVLAQLPSGTGSWTVQPFAEGLPGFCAAITGRCFMDDGRVLPTMLYTDDFVLLPATGAFTLSSSEPAMRAVAGTFRLDGANPGLLAALLPPAVQIRGSGRLPQLFGLVAAEIAAGLPGTDSMLSRLMEMMLVDAMRQTTFRDPPVGLLRGLGDRCLAPALELLHSNVRECWTVDQLASAAGLSRSAFHDRFTQQVGMAPWAYLQYWRIEIAKDLLRVEGMPIPDVAAQVGYGSRSAFSAAFRKQVGQSPAQYLRQRPACGIC